eukprot:403346886
MPNLEHLTHQEIIHPSLIINLNPLNHFYSLRVSTQTLHRPQIYKILSFRDLKNSTLLRGGTTTGDRMVPFRGVSNRTQSNFDALHALSSSEERDDGHPSNHFSQQNQEGQANSLIVESNSQQQFLQQSMHKAILYQSQHKVQSRKLRSNFNGNKWSPEDEELSIMNDYISENVQNCSNFDEMEELIQTQKKVGNLKKPLVLQFTDNKTPPMVITLFDELKDLNSMRYKEAQKLKLRDKIMKQASQIPYSWLCALSTEEISAESHHIFHWGQNGVCAIALQNKVYLIRPADPDPDQGEIEACKWPYIVKSLRWMNPVNIPGTDSNRAFRSQPDRHTECTLLAIATDNPIQQIIIFETQYMLNVRVLNQADYSCTSLSWNHHLLASVTTSGQLFINDVRINKSIVFEQSIPGIGTINYCTFSPDGKYLSLCGHIVCIYSVRFSIDPFAYYSSNDGSSQYSFSEHFALRLNSLQDSVLQVAWSYRTPNIFTFSQERRNQHQNQQTHSHQIMFYNVETKQCMTSFAIKSKPITLQFSINQHGLSNDAQMLFVGQENGKIALIKLRGVHAICLRMINYLHFHNLDKRVLHLQESPDGTHLGSITEDQLFILWKFNQPASAPPPLSMMPTQYHYHSRQKRQDRGSATFNTQAMNQNQRLKNQMMEMMQPHQSLSQEPQDHSNVQMMDCSDQLQQRGFNSNQNSQHGRDLMNPDEEIDQEADDEQQVFPSQGFNQIDNFPSLR